LTSHRLNGSSSRPVLTATCLSYIGVSTLNDFLTFFPNRPGGQTPQPIFTQNGSNDVDSRKDVPLALKIENFCTPCHPEPQNVKICQIFGIRKFSLDFAFNIEGLRSKHPYSLSQPNESAIVNRQCGCEKLKYVPKFWIGGTLEPNISKTLGDREARF